MSPPQEHRPVLAEALPTWPVHAVVGSVLIGAGATSLYRLLLEVGGERLSPLSVLLAEAELLGGIGMLSGLAPFAIRLFGLVIFGGLGTANLLLAWQGRCTGGGLGSWSLAPWVYVTLAVVSCGALFVSRPREGMESASIPGPAGMVGLILAATLVGLAGWREGGLVTISGTVEFDGRPLAGASLALTGASGEVPFETDTVGRFRVPLLRPGLYAVTVRHASAPAAADGDGPAPAWLTVVECPGAEQVRVGFDGRAG